MRITGITSRIISYDVSAIYGEAGPPQEISADYRYSFDTFHTDEGIDGHSMQFGWMGEGQAMGHALHQAYGRFLLGRDPMEHEHLWQDLRRQNRHEYNLTDTLLGTIDIALWDIRGKAAGLPIARMLGLARESDPHLRHGHHRQPDPGAGLRRRRSSGSDRAIAASRSSSGTAWNATSRGSGLPARPSAPTSRCSRTPPGSTRGPKRSRAGYALDELNYRWFEEPLPGPPGLPAQAPGR